MWFCLSLVISLWVHSDVNVGSSHSDELQIQLKDIVNASFQNIKFSISSTTVSVVSVASTS